MLISTKGRYALRIMIDLAENSGDGYVPLKEMAARQDISEKYLESILKVLVQNNLLAGLRGKGGGYRLTKAPQLYTVGSILRLTEGSLAPVTCLERGSQQCARMADCPTLPVWRKLDELVNNYLKSHNDESYMYELAGLTPREFYLYKVTGIYPCESYYGIAATKLMPLSTLVEMKLEQKEKKRKKRAQKQAAENSIAPARILARDQKKVRKEKQKWQRAKETAEKQLSFLEGLEEQIKEAVKHYTKASQEIRDKLCRAETWREMWPYDYVTQMKEMY